MARVCAVCWRPPREGEEMRPIRIRTEEDMAATGIDEVSLRQACLECVEEHRIRLAASQGVEPSTVTNNAMC